MIFFSWDKIYYIYVNKGDNYNCYFCSTIQKKCSLHNSNFCGCIKTESNIDIIEKYINFYKYSSKVIIFSNGKFRYIKKKNKNQLKFSI